MFRLSIDSLFAEEPLHGGWSFNGCVKAHTLTVHQWPSDLIELAHHTTVVSDRQFYWRINKVKDNWGPPHNMTARDIDQALERAEHQGATRLVWKTYMQSQEWRARFPDGVPTRIRYVPMHIDADYLVHLRTTQPDVEIAMAYNTQCVVRLRSPEFIDLPNFRHLDIRTVKGEHALLNLLLQFDDFEGTHILTTRNRVWSQVRNLSIRPRKVSQSRSRGPPICIGFQDDT